MAKVEYLEVLKLVMRIFVVSFSTFSKKVNILRIKILDVRTLIVTLGIASE